MALIEVIDIKVYYDNVEALRGISLQLEQGEIVALLGANGAGKSTLLKTISGFKRPTSGEIWYDGERIDGTKPYRIVAAGIAHVPEGRRVFADMTVLENLEMGAYLRKDIRRIESDLTEILKLFPSLKERKTRAAGTLSGGEQQMLALGRALMSMPKAVLMDEPSLGLSPIMVKEISKIITDINQKGISIILVEQNAKMALSVAHRAYVLQTGSLILSGKAKDLLEIEDLRKSYLLT
jgi:branched-chain amino acid transport system ATP-binding protein